MALHINATVTLSAGISEAYAGSMRMDPFYHDNAIGIPSVTMHNFILVSNPAGSATCRTAAFFKTDAAAGTHRAVNAGTTLLTITQVAAWAVWNINGMIHYMPLYTGKT